MKTMQFLGWEAGQLTGWLARKISQFFRAVQWQEPSVCPACLHNFFNQWERTCLVASVQLFGGVRPEVTPQSNSLVDQPEAWFIFLRVAQIDMACWKTYVLLLVTVSQVNSRIAQHRLPRRQPQALCNSGQQYMFIKGWNYVVQLSRGLVVGVGLVDIASTKWLSVWSSELVHPWPFEHTPNMTRWQDTSNRQDNMFSVTNCGTVKWWKRQVRHFG